MKATKLKKKYGKLRVLDTHSRNGRRVADCQCKCGVLRTVLVSHLTSGRTQTCGSTACRPPRRTRVPYDKDYRPTGNGMRAITLRKLWADLNDSTITRASVARSHNLNYATLSTLERSIWRAGGIRRYIAQVGAE